MKERKAILPAFPAINKVLNREKKEESVLKELRVENTTSGTGKVLEYRCNSSKWRIKREVQDWWKPNEVC